MSTRPPKTIAIIGAGPAGLAALKSVLETQHYKDGLWNPIVFESRSEVGGVWLPATPDPRSPDKPPATPLYDSLTTNLPHPLMSYADFPFPPSTPIFPKAEYVQRYLASYADTFSLRPFIRLSTRVTSMEYQGAGWTLKVRSTDSAQTETQPETILADLVMICNGHYASPRFPTTPGVADWLDRGLASHSMWYRHPPPSSSEKKEDKTILIVGAGPSGQDLTADFLALKSSPTTRYTIIHSTTEGAYLPSDERDAPQPNGNILKRRGRVVQYHPLPQPPNPRESEFGEPLQGTVTFEPPHHPEGAEGETISGISHVYLATGYDYDYPFLQPPILSDAFPPPLPLPPAPHQTHPLYNCGFSVSWLARHMWPLHLPLERSQLEAIDAGVTTYPPTSLAFLGLLSRVSPLPLVEVQAQAVLAAFSDPPLLDQVKETLAVEQRYKELRGSFGENSEDAVNEKVYKAWHKFEPMQQFDYREQLNSDFIARSTSASPIIPEWHREMYKQVGLLRQTWRALERSGEAEAFVRGVGSGLDPEAEWEGCLKRLLKRAMEGKMGEEISGENSVDLGRI
ncbi:hypothetical protein D9611_007058 [Ephemerocybe angulata]|uniref:Flavin-containing monooxygenase n=1 Tax=Ephemerocybe angulata TaxID=980116 RepID=A0A8H5EW61_9AGAR|nr:hypothetical protein D9611_007058 [Tulosesus angulatus]